MLADVICTTPQCTTGEAQVQEMDSTFQSAPVNIQAQYQSAHDSIMASYNSIYGIMTNYIPFNPDCCTLADLGNQAQTLQAQILSAMGQSGVSLTPTGGIPLTTLIVLVAGGYLVLVYLAGKK